MHIMLSYLKSKYPNLGGDYKEFSSFIDLYGALVDKNTSLSEIEKFNYLLSVLDGPPLSLIRTIPRTSDNYEIAYNTLNNRYSNKRIIAQMHSAAIENTSKINADNSIALRKLLDTFSENLAALKDLNFNVDAWISY